MIPHSLFQNRTLMVAFLGSSLAGLILWGAQYYMPLYFEAVKGYTPIMSDVALFPETFTVAPSAVICGILISVTGKYKWAL